VAQLLTQLTEIFVVEGVITLNPFKSTTIRKRPRLRNYWMFSGIVTVTGSNSSVQYMSAVWYANDDQKQVVEKSKKEYENKNDCRVTSKIAPLTSWTDAEDYHQKYYLRSHPGLLKALSIESDKSLLESTVAVKLNSYIAGCTAEERKQILKDLNESPELDDSKREYIKNYLAKNR